ncbi:BadF/BadG/BcrA/BcrD ATPase family protein [Halioxenophilus aromaticivorans]|uniref:BadF/BadG/BcrA/BcrD ATPase family protein n=1 Tax=Halioxenophilus aromaticivorans TaxID=1306992 RepID=A0AAV3U2Q2_9ALTE
MTFFLGVDGGGSTCRARLENSAGEVLGAANTGPANLASEPGRALANIEAAINQAIAAAGDQFSLADYQHTQCVLGLAGYNMARGQRGIDGWQSPFEHTYITSDMHIACAGAHAGADGAIIITGTGSAAFVQHAGQHQQLGGYGLTLGDQASGAWLGAQSIEYLLQMFDGLIPACKFLKAVQSQIQCHDGESVFENYSAAVPAQFASLAPTVFQYAEQSELALAIIQEACDYVEKLVARVQSMGAVRVALTGGMSKALQAYLSPAVQRALSSPGTSPLAGAIILAKNLHVAEAKPC